MTGECYSHGVDEDYSSELDGILSTPLSPENINTYGEDALDSTIRLVNKYRTAYGFQPTVTFATQAETETAAASYYGLPDVNDILDHLAEKTDEITLLGRFIGRAAMQNTLFVPPDTRRPNISAGNGSFEQKNTIERLKTTLFILQNDFEINVHDDAELHLSEGIIAGNTMRRESYYVIDVPKLDRTILICDEEGNVSYVFDVGLLEERDVTSKQVISSTKTELNDLLDEDPRVGQRLAYSKQFVSRMRAAIINPASLSVDANVSGSDYLYPHAPEGTSSMHAMRNEWGIVGSSAIYSAIKNLEDVLGPVSKYRFSSNNLASPGYTRDQKDLIKRYLHEKGIFADEAPECYLSLQGTARQFSVTDKTLGVAVNELGAELGETPILKFGPRRVLGFSPWQQNMIFDRLVDRGAYTPQAPENYNNVSGIESAVGLNAWTIHKAIEQLGDTLGEAAYYKFSKNDTDKRYVRTRGFSPEQQLLIVGLAQQLDQARPANNRSPFSSWLFEARTSRGIKQKDLAREIGISVSYLAHFSSPNAPLPQKNITKKVVDTLADVGGLVGEAKDKYIQEQMDLVESFYNQ